jgi:hypothetical protein
MPWLSDVSLILRPQIIAPEKKGSERTVLFDRK